MVSNLYAWLAAAMILLGLSGYIAISWMSGWNEMSNAVVIRRVLALVVGLEAANLILAAGYRSDEALLVTSAVLLVAIPVIVVTHEAVQVRYRRRSLVAALARGQQLPRGVDKDDVLLWAARHSTTRVNSPNSDL